MPSLLEEVLVTRHSNAVSAGTSTITPSSGIDTAGYGSHTFLVLLGDVTSTGTPGVKVQQSSDDGDQDAYSDLEGSAWLADDADDNGIIAVEVIHPGKRYIKCLVTRAVANAVVDGILCLQTGARRKPVTPSTLGNERFTVPDEGTA